MSQEIVLRGYPKQIAELLKCDAQTAEKVFSILCQWDFDFSACSQRSFNKNVKLALAEVKGD